MKPLSNEEINEQLRAALGDERPFFPFLEGLYDAKSLYSGYEYGNPQSYYSCFDAKVYRHYIEEGKVAKNTDEALARVLHDRCIMKALQSFLSAYDERDVVGIMGGHKLSRCDEQYRRVALLSKRLTEGGALMISGGGPGAMEATHLGAWMAERSDEEFEDALSNMRIAPFFENEHWFDSAIEVMNKYPQVKYRSLGIPTWLYGHEPTTPLATDIAKFFDNSIREDTILTVAYGGIVYAPGSAGTLQEIFQDATQNHYLSFGYSSPMIFMGEHFWREEVPLYNLFEYLMQTGKYKNLRLMLSDDINVIAKEIEAFRTLDLSKNS